MNFKTSKKTDGGNEEFRRMTVTKQLEVPPSHTQAESTTDADFEFRATIKHAWDLQCEKQYEAASEQYETALRMKTEVEELMNFAYSNLALCSFSLKKYEKAIREHEIHSEVAKRAKNIHMENLAYNNKGLALSALGKFVEARICLEKAEKALGFLNGAQYSTLLLLVYANLGNTCASMNDFDNAVIYHQKQLNLAKKLEDSAATARASHNLENDYSAMSEYKKANAAREAKVKYYNEGNDANVLLGNFKNSVLPSVHSGWAIKHPGQSSTGPWKKSNERVLLVLKDGHVCYYRDISGSQKPQRYIICSEITDCEHWGKPEDAARNFKISVAHRSFWFTCPTSNEADVWIDLIKKSADGSEPEPGRKRNSSSASSALPKLSQPRFSSDELDLGGKYHSTPTFAPSSIFIPGDDRVQTNPLFGRTESVALYGLLIYCIVSFALH